MLLSAAAATAAIARRGGGGGGGGGGGARKAKGVPGLRAAREAGLRAATPNHHRSWPRSCSKPQSLPPAYVRVVGAMRLRVCAHSTNPQP